MESAVKTPTTKYAMGHANHGISYEEILEASVTLTDENKRELVLNDKRISNIALEKELQILELTDCEFKDNSIAEILVTLINQGLETLVLSGSHISGHHLQHVGENMSEENESLTELDLSHIELDEVGVRAVSKICTKTRRLDWLNLHDCGLNGESLKILSEAEKRDHPIQELTLSSNPQIRDSVDAVADLVDKFRCEEVDISTNSLDGSHFAELADASAPKKISTIRVCDNPIDSWESLGKLVKKWKVKVLDVSLCIMYLNDIQEFVSTLGDYQLNGMELYNPQRCEPLAKKLSAAVEGILAPPDCTLL